MKDHEERPEHEKHLLRVGLKLGRKVTILTVLLVAAGIVLINKGYPLESLVFSVFLFLACVIIAVGGLPESAPAHALIYVIIGQQNSIAYSIALWISDFGLRFNDKEPFCLLIKGASCLGLERYVEAENYCTLSINVMPDVCENYINRGYARYKLSKHELAEQDFSKAIELQPKYVFAYFCRSIVRSIGKDEESLTKALEDANMAIKLAPNYGLAFYMRANVYRKMNRLEESLNDMDEYLNSSKTYQRPSCFILMENEIQSRGF